MNCKTVAGICKKRSGSFFKNIDELLNNKMRQLLSFRRRQWTMKPRLLHHFLMYRLLLIWSSIKQRACKQIVRKETTIIRFLFVTFKKIQNLVLGSHFSFHSSCYRPTKRWECQIYFAMFSFTQTYHIWTKTCATASWSKTIADNVSFSHKQEGSLKSSHIIWHHKSLKKNIKPQWRANLSDNKISPSQRIGHVNNIPTTQFFTALEFPEILSQNLIYYHCLSVSGKFDIMHCGILINMPYFRMSTLWTWSSMDGQFKHWNRYWVQWKYNFISLSTVLWLTYLWLVSQCCSIVPTAAVFIVLNIVIEVWTLEKWSTIGINVSLNISLANRFVAITKNIIMETLLNESVRPVTIQSSHVFRVFLFYVFSLFLFSLGGSWVFGKSED